MITNIQKNILAISIFLLLSTSSVSWVESKQAIHAKHGFFAELDDIIPVFDVNNSVPSQLPEAVKQAVIPT